MDAIFFESRASHACVRKRMSPRPSFVNRNYRGRTWRGSIFIMPFAASQFWTRARPFEESVRHLPC